MFQCNLIRHYYSKVMFQCKVIMLNWLPWLLWMQRPGHSFSFRALPPLFAVDLEENSESLLRNVRASSAQNENDRFFNFFYFCSLFFKFVVFYIFDFWRFFANLFCEHNSILEQNFYVGCTYSILVI